MDMNKVAQEQQLEEKYQQQHQQMDSETYDELVRTPEVTEHDGESALSLTLDADGSLLWYLPSFPLASNSAQGAGGEGSDQGGGPRGREGQGQSAADMLPELEACLQNSQRNADAENRWPEKDASGASGRTQFFGVGSGWQNNPRWRQVNSTIFLRDALY